MSHEAMFYAIPNLVSSTAAPCVPWQWSQLPPKEVCGPASKKLRDKWREDPKLNWQLFSSFEGFIPNQRLSEPKRGTSDEGNPPLRCGGFVCDYDAPVSDSELETGIARMGEYVPNFYEKTMSGNATLVWIFEKPVSFPNRRFAVEFLELALSKLHFESVAVKFDKPAFLAPERYYTNSGEWYAINETARIPYALLNGWIAEVGEKHHWRKDRGSVEIPLPVVAAELAKKYPTFPNCWPGDFVEGAQGPSFWVEGSTSPKSAIVKTTGLFTFAGHAIKPFFPWADLLGVQFVEKYRTEMMGKAVDGIYHDGTKYYRKDGYGDWKWYAKEDIVSHLNVDRGLSVVKDNGAPSEVSRAIQYIQNWQAVVGAAPFVFQQTGVLTRNGNRFLNTHTRRAMSPSSEKTVWGPSGNMPFLSRFFDGIFDPREQLDFFLSWLARYYRGAYEMNLESGQNVFFLGSQGVGKTLLSQGILPRLVGGSADAEDYLLGKTQFNSDLFEVGLWTVDDNSATVSLDTHRKFSAMVKKMAANTTFSYHAKFRIPCFVEWLGRVVVTANDDEESARIVPDLSISILDKLHLFRASKTPPVEYPSRRKMIAILDEELPRFARFLLDYEVPSHCVGTARYGVKAYHEPSLLKTAEQSSRTAAFTEILDDWIKSYFDESKDEYWQGTAFQLLKALHKDPMASEAGLRNLTPQSVGQALAALKAKGTFQLTVDGSGFTRQWRVYRPGTDAKVVELPTGSKFAK